MRLRKRLGTHVELRAGAACKSPRTNNVRALHLTGVVLVRA